MSLTTEQITNRATGLGGSDAAAACGLSRWKSPLQVYLEKRGEAPAFEGNTFTEWGNALEPAIRQAYSNATGRVVRLPEETLRHPTYTFLLCHPDGVTDDGRLFEAKNTRSDKDWGELGTDQVPQEYLMQVQHNMLVTGLPVADVAVLIGGSDFRIYTVERDIDLHNLLIEAESALWKRIESGNPPPPTTAEDVMALWGRVGRSVEVEADELVEAQVAELRSLKDERAQVDEQIEKVTIEIQKWMREADTLTRNGRILATWKETKPRESFDVAAFRAAHPDLAAAFTRTGQPTRRFLLKG